MKSVGKTLIFQSGAEKTERTKKTQPEPPKTQETCSAIVTHRCLEADTRDAYVVSAYSPDEASKVAKAIPYGQD